MLTWISHNKDVINDGKAHCKWTAPWPECMRSNTVALKIRHLQCKGLGTLASKGSLLRDIQVDSALRGFSFLFIIGKRAEKQVGVGWKD